ncbi:MAG: DUF3667 domain-containing protein [Balneolales bacterium]|nr:DUF3667 domain-containing protein [Balneolales bacterium]
MSSGLITSEECASCGEIHENAFCPNCGERRLSEKDHSVVALLKDFSSDIFDLDNKLYRTLKSFFYQPAIYASQYIRGARKKFISPIKIFILANAWYFFFPIFDTFKTTLDIQLTGLPQSRFTYNFIQQVIVNSGLSEEDFTTEYNALTSVISKAILVLLPVFIGFFTWLLNVGKREEKPLIMHLNYAFIAVAFLLLVVISTIPGLYRLLALAVDSDLLWSIYSERNITTYVLILINGYAYVLYKDFFEGSGLVKFGKAVIMNLLFIPLIQFYRFILLILTLGWMKLF